MDKKASVLKKSRNRFSLPSRVGSLRKEIKLAFTVAVISIIIIELILKRFESPWLWFYSLGDIYLKICYSISAASIFYFINQHLPKEEKKLKAYRYINNKIHFIHRHVWWLLSAMSVDCKDGDLAKVSADSIHHACKSIKAQQSVTISYESGKPFPNWWDYLNYKCAKIQGAIDDLIVLDDAIESRVFQRLLNIDDVMANHLSTTNLSLGNEDISYCADGIFELVQETVYLKQALRKYSRFWPEYNNAYRKDRQRYSQQ